MIHDIWVKSFELFNKRKLDVVATLIISGLEECNLEQYVDLLSSYPKSLRITHLYSSGCIDSLSGVVVQAMVRFVPLYCINFYCSRISIFLKC